MRFPHGPVRVGAAAFLLLAGTPLPIAAQPSGGCRLVCTPSLSFQPSLTRNHLFNAPRVRSLSNGSEKTLPAHTNLQFEFALSIPTAVPRTSLGLSLSWLPQASASENPFTEYTASDLEADEVRANLPTLSATVSYTLLTDAQTNGWLSIDASAGDQFSKAAQPGDGADYTHKLTLGLATSVGVFNGVPEQTWLHGVALSVVLGYVATGLPHAGDEVPQGERVFLDSVHSPTLTIGLQLPLTP